MSNDIAARRLPHVVIVGAGFAGLEAAKIISRRRDVTLTIVDRCNYHLFQPLLYQVATAGLSPANIATPTRSILSRISGRSNRGEVLLADVEAIDPDASELRLDGGERLSFDYLLLATGARHAYFGHEEWETHAPGLKTLDDATEIRRRILLAFERAEREKNPERIKEMMTFVLVGAGPTGIELAGAIAELAKFALAKEFHTIHPESARVVLLEGGARILSAFPEDLAARALSSLKKLGVEVRTNAIVTSVDADGVTIGSGERLKARTVIWAAGVRASPLGQCLGAELDSSGRVIVAPDLSIGHHPKIFVAGDLMRVPFGSGIVPGVAPAAIQSGRLAARNILAKIDDRATKPFFYFDKGNLATIGRAAAICHLGRMKLSGYLAWWVWLVVHIMYLIGFRSKILVVIEWAWSYFTFGRSSRLVFGAMGGKGKR